MKPLSLTLPRFIHKLAALFLVSLVSLTAVVPTSSVNATSLNNAKTYKRVGTLSISKLKVTSPIYLGVTDDVFNRGVGHWPGTAKPGARGNLVLGGHRTSAKREFADIDRLRGGDIISISVGTKTHRYVVTGHMIVKPTSVWITEQTRSATLTIFSCHPKGKITSRYVVRAVLQT
ncbi:MAG: class E sortase [Ilumatobacteraceae bacterium]|nr:class E sortase [Ilumatobacteraceae bacterium]